MGPSDKLKAAKEQLGEGWDYISHSTLLHFGDDDYYIQVSSAKGDRYWATVVGLFDANASALDPEKAVRRAKSRYFEKLEDEQIRIEELGQISH